MLPGQRPVNDRSHGMQHVLRRKVEAGRNLRLSSGFFVSLLLHQLMTGQPQLYPSHGVDDVVDTAMAR